MPWALIFKLIFMLPSIISAVIKIWKLIKEFEVDGFWSIAQLAKEILEIILGLASVNKRSAKEITSALEYHMVHLNQQRIVGKIQANTLPNSLVDLKERAESML